MKVSPLRALTLVGNDCFHMEFFGRNESNLVVLTKSIRYIPEKESLDMLMLDLFLIHLKILWICHMNFHLYGNILRYTDLKNVKNSPGILCFCCIGYIILLSISKEAQNEKYLKKRAIMVLNIVGDLYYTSSADGCSC